MVTLKQILGTLDSVTCSLCGSMDGMIFPRAQLKQGISQPPFHPNCRCTTVPYDEDWDYNGQRIAKDKEGKYYYVPENMSYEEWKKEFVEGEKAKYSLKISDVSNVSTTFSDKNVSTNGLRNEIPLNFEQVENCKKYLTKLGYDDIPSFTNNSLTSMHFGETENGDKYSYLVVGTDVYPSESNIKNANSRVSYKGALAHEVVGHYEAWIAKQTQMDDILEEAQASIRAGRFGVDLSIPERIVLYKDALTRLRNSGIKLKDVKNKLYINRR